MERIDTRSLHPEARNELRRTVIRLRQQSGMSCQQLAEIAGVHVVTVREWVARAQREGVGSLTEKKRGRPVGSCRKISLVQEQWLRQQIVGFTPKQLVLPFALWTRRAIKALIVEKFGVELSDRLVGKYLKRCDSLRSGPSKGRLSNVLNSLSSGSRTHTLPLKQRPRQRGPSSSLATRRRSRKTLSGFEAMRQKERHRCLRSRIGGTRCP